jgi:hypothetical protein
MDKCDRCGKAAELYHNEASGLAFCDACETAATEASRDFVTIYLTREQIYALVAVANDSLVGVQIHTDDASDSSLTCEAVQIDNSNALRCFEIEADGSHRETT